MTRARTTTITDSDTIDCAAINALARCVSGRVSVGLKATTPV